MVLGGMNKLRQNLFAVKRLKGKTLLRPPLSAGALPGTVREYVMNELAPKYRLDTVEQNISPIELFDADEIFLTNALIGIMSLVEIDGKHIGSGEPGVITLVLTQSFEE